MAPSPNPRVRRPLIAGVLFGLFLATLRGHWDSLERTHDANPFHARGSRSGTPDPVSEIGWDARAFGEEAAASADARREKASEKEHAVRVETRANVSNDVDVSVVDVGDDDEKRMRLFEPFERLTESSPGVASSVFEPLSLRYPDPFATFRGCEPEPPRDGLRARRLDLVADPTDAAWPVNCAGHETLCALLRSTAIDREVLVAVANSAAPGIFDFVASVEKLGVRNFIVVALDDALHAKLGARGVASYRVRNDAVGSHKVSAQKFSIVNEFVERGCSVLLTDTDVAYLRNPFPFLFRDSDVESMSDGWDAGSAFGFLETVDDASLGRDKNSGRRRAKTFRVAALNSGMWLVMATRASARLMTTMARRMATEPNLWDQSGYNLELWFASRDDVRVSGATVRVLHPLCFVNSKVMFRFIRHAPSLRKEAHTPVAMHSNYHTDKALKMQRVVEYYTKAEATADVLNRGCVVGCDANLRSVAQLERDAKANVNDAIVGSKKWTEGGEGVWGGKGAAAKAGGNADPSHCKPRTPLANSGRVAAYAPHAVPGNRGDFCARLRSQSRETTDAIARATCAALSELSEKESEKEIFVVAVDADDARASEAWAALARDGIRPLGLVSRTVFVTNDAALARAATNTHGIKATVVVERRGRRGTTPKQAGATENAETQNPETQNPSMAATKWSVATVALADGRPVFLLDPRVALFADPSSFLHGDADVEAGSDGWDDTTAYGYDHVVDDPAMDWSRFCHGGRVVGNDPGFAKLAATEEALRLARLVARRAAAHARSDEMTDLEFEHLAFNEALYLPSFGDYVGPGVVKRTLNYLCFANSKTAFRFMRKDKKFRDPREHTPVSVRLSYHPNEAVERADALVRFYARGDAGALAAWRDGEVSGGGGGEEPGGARDAGASCADSAALRDLPPAAPREEDSHALGRHFRLHRDWSWGGVTPFSFGPAGALSTPWGEGAWGFIPTNAHRARTDNAEDTSNANENVVAVDGRAVYANSVFARFVGAVHVLTFEPDDEGEPYAVFVSERCQDGDMVVGRAVSGGARADR
jgi:hypothetical protein